MTEFKICPYCYFDKVHQNAQKCKKCGEWLEKNKLNTKKTNYSEEHIKIALIVLSGILIISLIFGGIYLLISKSNKDDSKKNSTKNEPEITYECYVKNGSPLKDFVDCNSQNEIKFYNNPDQEGEPFLVLDKQKLIQSCVESDCPDQKIKENQDYIINKTELKNKKIIIYFSGKPNEEDLNTAMGRLSHDRNVVFGDQFEFIIGNSGESLLLSYDFFPVKMGLVNNKKTTHKSVVFDVENTSSKENEFEFIDTNQIVVHNFNQMKAELNKYLNRTSIDGSLKTTFEDLAKQISGATSDNNMEYLIYLNINDKNVDLPINNLGYGFNNESCERWHKYADNNNITIENNYRRCMASDDPEKRCSRAGMLNRSYYNYYSPILRQKKALLDGANKTVLMNIKASIPEESACKNELTQIITNNY